MSTIMSSQEFERIKSCIVKVKEAGSRASGVQERIKKQLHTDFEIDSEEEHKTRIESLKADIEADEEKRDKFMEKLANITDWSSI